MKMAINKNFLLELSVFIAIVAVAGHLTTHFWDRYFFHHEISNMKTNLHMLKHTVRHIGAAYDDLHKELNELAKIEQRRSSLDYQKNRHNQYDHRNSRDRRSHYEHFDRYDRKSIGGRSSTETDKHQQHLDRRKQHEINVLAKLKDEGKFDAEPKKHEHITKFAQTKNLENATTITRSCLKSTGVGINTKQYCVFKQQCRCNKTRPNKHWRY